MINDACGVVPSGAGLNAFFSGVVEGSKISPEMFKVFMGCSSGAVALAWFKAMQNHLTLNLWTNKNTQRRLFGIVSRVISGYWADVDRLIDVVCDELNMEAVVSSSIELHVGMFNIEKGVTEYVNIAGLSCGEARVVLKNTCSPAGISKPYEFRGKLYCDGGTEISLPFRQAKKLGLGKFLVFANRPEGCLIKPFPVSVSEKFLSKPEFRLVREVSERRVEIYQDSIQAAKDDQNTVVIYPPKEVADIDPFHHSPKIASQLFGIGVEAGKAKQGLMFELLEKQIPA